MITEETIKLLYFDVEKNSNYNINNFTKEIREIETKATKETINAVIVLLRDYNTQNNLMKRTIINTLMMRIGEIQKELLSTIINKSNKNQDVKE